jgi:PAS domain S-box-containing protein
VSKTAPLDVAAHLSAIVASSDDVIVSKTLDGIIMSWNPAAERIFGYSAEEAIGQHITLVIPPERWTEEDEVLSRIRRGDRVDHFETVRRAKSGRLINISLTVSPIRDAKGRIVGASKVARDITDRLRADEERERLLRSEKEAREAGEEANRIKDEFLATVSHELRNPLNAITGWSSLLVTGRLDQEQTRRAHETILRNAQSQSQLISDLLDVSRIVVGKLRLNVVPVQFAAVIEAALEVVRPAAAAKSIRLNAHIDADSGAIAGDPDRLQQVFWNLLSNAIKFTPKGGRVEIRSRRANSHIEVVVTDTGKGINAKLLPRIFDRFRQGESTSTTREFGGLGLGLAIVRHLVELHGGIVNARSEGTDKGAVFTVELPISVGVESFELGGQVHRIIEGATEGSALSLSGLRVLVVDDEADARDMVSAILVQVGAEVAVAASVAQALDLLDRWRPDVLISDIGMLG